jgi:formate--tetrahydrofolate ligase
MSAKAEPKILSDIEIARNAKMRPIIDVACDLGLREDDLETYGKCKAKISHEALERVLSDKQAKRGKLILVTAITPTKSGEGKTTTSIGLGQALRQKGLRAAVALREPSMGPVFGQKGGGTGGGYSQLMPMDEINLHFTGDLHAIGAANNLLAALVDNHIYFGNQFQIDPASVSFKRALDVNDRSLRSIVQGVGGKTSGVLRETGFDITAASEVMATLCMADSMTDLETRLGKIVVAKSKSGDPVTASQLGAVGAMSVILRDAIKPNIVQTLDGTPALVHGGPFANIAHGASSVISSKLALHSTDYVITECGFGADLGLEKYCDIVSQINPELAPDAVVMVVTIKALKLHGGKAESELKQVDLNAIEKGFANLQQHLENVAKFGLPSVVCLNKYTGDTDEEINHVLALCRSHGFQAAMADVWSKGGDGAGELAELALEATRRSSKLKSMYHLEHGIEQKISAVANQIYRADSVEFGAQAKKEMKWLSKNGYSSLPVCIAKTQYSFSDDPVLIGAPSGFKVRIRQLKLSAGAGFIVAISGEILTMPGLPKSPAADRMSIDRNSRRILLAQLRS